VQRCEQQLGGVLGKREHVRGLSSKVRLAGKLWWAARTAVTGNGLGWQLKQGQDLSKQVTGGKASRLSKCLLHAADSSVCLRGNRIRLVVWSSWK
jgi:hypothetical protein